MFREPRRSKNVKIVKIAGGTGGRGGRGGIHGGSGGAGEGPRMKILSAKTVKNYSTIPAVPSGFRTIPFGDIDLQREIYLHGRSGVVSLRRLHSAKLLVDRERLDVTVAVYQGAGAEQEWRRHIKKYMATLSHPNIVQLYGTASYGNIHAAVFHDDLIPLQQMLDLYAHAPMSTVYIHVYIRLEFWKVCDYFETIFQRSLAS
ncbi:hypothetical protein MSAN_00302400 [Mycena sanguinolenta]|uniref:Protein kinase domain-containing protein n=1 Tax=Mycena sanguinolenta TaxID=230812 RepID=A0A8H7DJ54_9AGAR|nr:hypothetical protein MSAN_00302400 [Mycena sanguinolenta]